MSSLKEIKKRIASVRSTLKITSAMKMVAMTKLQHAQQAVENMRPYEAQLSAMLHPLLYSAAAACCKSGSHTRSPFGSPAAEASDTSSFLGRRPVKSGRVCLVAFSSNSALCGSFNSNVIRLAKERIDELSKDFEVEVVSVGRKMAEAVKRMGFESPEDYSQLAAHGRYEGAAALAQTLIERYRCGRYDEIYLVHNHFVSTAVQKSVCERYLPDAEPQVESDTDGYDYILEPSAEKLLEDLMPKVLRLRIYTVLLDSLASEHAARAVAMQTATDNAELILNDLTLEYNKGRQQKITSEIMDIVCGSFL